ncbi:hypothetical protein CEUSTIGMA_g10714.t1 [Chlamydomonas eustigma]|uniref:Uncharacterized protein n=1 Tax=Chlamydomonas eustigma TaxID=1157962 RepID=A0A250XJP7_9CHLO|nr:hypothetical protein CEUSTIGMA_g10714.t1 [Chlamydomonas eustigma]|eukprot:GAX83288.1 hypothetical protein CEUSTIGMA_g10714.t1 [Chlamydomonas eustigma]
MDAETLWGKAESLGVPNAFKLLQKMEFERPCKWNSKFEKAVERLRLQMNRMEVAIGENDLLKSKENWIVSGLQVLSREEKWMHASQTTLSSSISSAPHAAVELDICLNVKNSTTENSFTLNNCPARRAHVVAAANDLMVDDLSSYKSSNPLWTLKVLHPVDAWDSSFLARVDVMRTRDLLGLHKEWLQEGAMLLPKAELMGPGSSAYAKLHFHCHTYRALCGRLMQSSPVVIKNLSHFELDTFTPVHYSQQSLVQACSQRLNPHVLRDIQAACGRYFAVEGKIQCEREELMGRYQILMQAPEIIKLIMAPSESQAVKMDKNPNSITSSQPSLFHGHGRMSAQGSLHQMANKDEPLAAAVTADPCLNLQSACSTMMLNTVSQNMLIDSAEEFELQLFMQQDQGQQQQQQQGSACCWTEKERTSSKEWRPSCCQPADVAAAGQDLLPLPDNEEAWHQFCASLLYTAGTTSSTSSAQPAVSDDNVAVAAAAAAAAAPVQQIARRPSFLIEEYEGAMKQQTAPLTGGAVGPPAAAAAGIAGMPGPPLLHTDHRDRLLQQDMKGCIVSPRPPTAAGHNLSAAAAAAAAASLKEGRTSLDHHQHPHQLCLTGEIAAGSPSDSAVSDAVPRRGCNSSSSSSLTGSFSVRTSDTHSADASSTASAAAAAAIDAMGLLRTRSSCLLGSDVNDATVDKDVSMIHYHASKCGSLMSDKQQAKQARSARPKKTALNTCPHVQGGSADIKDAVIDLDEVLRGLQSCYYRQQLAYRQCLQAMSANLSATDEMKLMLQFYPLAIGMHDLLDALSSFNTGSPAGDSTTAAAAAAAGGTYVDLDIYQQAGRGPCPSGGIQEAFIEPMQAHLDQQPSARLSQQQQKLFVFSGPAADYNTTISQIKTAGRTKRCTTTTAAAASAKSIKAEVSHAQAGGSQAFQPSSGFKP